MDLQPKIEDAAQEAQLSDAGGLVRVVRAKDGIDYRQGGIDARDAFEPPLPVQLCQILGHSGRYDKVVQGQQVVIVDIPRPVPAFVGVATANVAGGPAEVRVGVVVVAEPRVGGGQDAGL